MKILIAAVAVVAAVALTFGVFTTVSSASLKAQVHTLQQQVTAQQAQISSAQARLSSAQAKLSEKTRMWSPVKTFVTCKTTCR